MGYLLHCEDGLFTAFGHRRQQAEVAEERRKPQHPASVPQQSGLPDSKETPVQPLPINLAREAGHMPQEKGHKH